MGKLTLNIYNATFNEVDSATIVLNEEHNIYPLLENIYNVVDDIIIVDGKSTDKTVEKIKSFPDPDRKIKLYIFDFFNGAKGMIGDQKNLAISKTNSLWTLFIDADERLNENLRKDFRSIIRENQDKDLIDFLRFNYVDNTPEEKDKEYQLRLFKSYCRYISSVHEELVGWRQENRIQLPEKYFITHNKDKTTHTERNLFYNEMEVTRPHKSTKKSRALRYNIEDANAKLL